MGICLFVCVGGHYAYYPFVEEGGVVRGCLFVCVVVAVHQCLSVCGKTASVCVCLSALDNAGEFLPICLHLGRCVSVWQSCQRIIFLFPSSKSLVSFSVLLFNQNYVYLLLHSPKKNNAIH